MAETTENAAPQKVQLTISGLRNDLINGINRKEIAKKYGLTQAQITEVFRNPKLKGLKVRKATVQVELLDDEQDNASSTGAGSGAAPEQEVAQATTPTEVKEEQFEASKTEEAAPAVTSEKGAW